MVRPTIHGQEEAHSLLAGPRDLAFESVEFANVRELLSPSALYYAVPNLELESSVNLLAAVITGEGRVTGT